MRTCIQCSLLTFFLVILTCSIIQWYLHSMSRSSIWHEMEFLAWKDSVSNRVWTDLLEGWVPGKRVIVVCVWYGLLNFLYRLTRLWIVNSYRFKNKTLLQCICIVSRALQELVVLENTFSSRYDLRTPNFILMIAFLGPRSSTLHSDNEKHSKLSISWFPSNFDLRHLLLLPCCFPSPPPHRRY